MAGGRITEKFEYNTKILTSYDGKEQRIQLLQYPRHLITFDYPSMNCFDAQWLRGLGKLRQTDAIHIPMWHNAFRMTDNYQYLPTTAVTYIQAPEESMFDLQNCEAIEIYQRADINQWDNFVKIISSVSGRTLRLKTLLTQSLDKRNSFIIPLRKCSIQPMTNLQYVYSNGTNISVGFEDILERNERIIVLDDYIYPYDITETWNRWNLPERYKGREVFLFTPQWVDDDSVTMSIEKAVNRLDNETGIFYYDLRNNNTYDINTWNITLMNRQECHNMIRFFDRVKGMFKSFYAPSWVNDIELVEDIEAGKNFIYTDWRKIKFYYSNNTRKKKLIVFTKDWKYYIFDILAYLTETRSNNNKQYGKIMLSSPIQQTIPLNNILMCSYFNLVRLDSDSLQLNYETGYAANVSFSFREVDDE